MIKVYRFEVKNALAKPNFLSNYRLQKIKDADELYVEQSIWSELVLIYALKKHQEISVPLDIKVNPLGKPYVDNAPSFSVTHSRPYVLVAVSNEEVGIDIEMIREDKPKLAAKFMNEKEYTTYKELNGYNKPFYFYQVWTAKEALIKLLGTSITKNLKEIETDFSENKIRFKNKTYALNQHMNENYVMSLASHGDVEYTWHDVTETSLLDI